MSYTLTNPIFTTKVVAYERLAYNPKVWFKEYECYNIRNIEIYDVLIDITKPETVSLPKMLCKGCGKQIDGDRHVTIVEGEWYCNFDCFCEHNSEKVKRLLEDQ